MRHFQLWPTSYFQLPRGQQRHRARAAVPQVLHAASPRRRREPACCLSCTGSIIPSRGYSDLTVVCWDRHLLLARVAGALAAQSINILSADFFRRGDHLVLRHLPRLHHELHRRQRQGRATARSSFRQGRVPRPTSASAGDRREMPPPRRWMPSAPNCRSVSIPNNHLSPDENVLGAPGARPSRPCCTMSSWPSPPPDSASPHARINTERCRHRPPSTSRTSKAKTHPDKRSSTSIAVSQAALQGHRIPRALVLPLRGKGAEGRDSKTLRPPPLCSSAAKRATYSPQPLKRRSTSAPTR